MLSTLLVSAAIACAPDAPRAPFDHRSALELVVRVDAGRLHLCNPSDAPELVILADRLRGFSLTLPLAAHAELEFSYETSALANFELSVVTRDGDGVHMSPSLALERIVECAESRTACCTSRSDHVHTWVWSGSSWEPSALPSDQSTLSPLSGPNSPRMRRHVPVITPSDGQRGNLPPRLERKPLPAV